MKYLFILTTLVLELLAASVVPAQVEFSADIVDIRQPGPSYPKLATVYFTETKRRIDMAPSSGESAVVMRMRPASRTKDGVEMWIGHGGDIVILDIAANESTLLRPQEKTYGRAPIRLLAPAEIYGLYVFVHLKNAEDACGEWADRLNGEICTKVGPAVVGGRKAIKYDLTCHEEHCHLWIDRELQSLIKRESPWSSTELRNIQVGPQPPTLFETPEGYAQEKLGGVIHSSPRQ